MKYLAFDFGDGTTMAAVYDSDSDKLEIPNIQLGIKEVPSILGIRKNNQVDVGITALQNSPENPQIVLASYWKERPTLTEGTDYSLAEREKFTIKFMNGIFNDFKSQNPGYDNEGFKTIIGIPSAWSEEDAQIYSRWASEAGLVNVEVCRESQAAILYARKYLENQIEKDALKKGILMVDLGSSTTDFTYLKGLDTAKNDGINLGAHEIEKILWRNGNPGYNKSPKDYYQDPTLEKDHLFQVRTIKEKAFSVFGNAGNDYATGNYIQDWDINGNPVNYPIGEKVNGVRGLVISKSWLEALLEKYPFMLAGQSISKTWRQHFSDGLRNFIRTNEVDVDNLTVFVTGGASRMYFLKQDILRTLENETVEIVDCPDHICPELVVSGLAWAGYANDEFQKAMLEWSTETIFNKFYENLPFRDYVIKNKFKDALSQEKILNGINNTLEKCNADIRKVIDEAKDNTLSPDDVKKLYADLLGKSIKELLSTNSDYISRYVISLVETEYALVKNFWQSYRKVFGATDLEFNYPNLDNCFVFEKLSDKNFDWFKFLINCFPTTILGNIWIFFSDINPKTKEKLHKIFNSRIAISQNDLESMCYNTIKIQLGESIFSKICECTAKNRQDELNAIFASFTY